MITVKDVALRAGVSTSTVTRAFRDDASISPAKRQAVLQAADQLGYMPNLLARGLKSNKSNIIGIDICNVENPFYNTIIKVVTEEFKKRGYHLLLTYSNGDVQEECRNLALFAGTRAEGVILMPTSQKNANVIQNYMKKGISFVQLFNTTYSFMDTVTVLDDQGAYYATLHLLDHGHRNILLFNVNTPFNNDRADGYRRAFQQYQLPYNENNIVTLGGTSTDQADIERYIQLQKPTAILAGTYTIGKNTVHACQNLNLQIPEDVSLITFDDVEWPELLHVTAVAQPIQYIGLTAVRIILDRIDGKNTNPQPVITSMEPELILRRSVKRLNERNAQP